VTNMALSVKEDDDVVRMECNTSYRKYADRGTHIGCNGFIDVVTSIHTQHVLRVESSQRRELPDDSPNTSPILSLCISPVRNILSVRLRRYEKLSLTSLRET
jgi:hypothetical protein